ncbi:MAG: prephenate dehydrogenase/arogenate dehydrogenase family protein [Treponema sp.]|jgi:prephenate dehydrogenase|nr:prephenate dehydrogenase/arogenate dehydrogenase family protein [Treponema sp.]
MKKIEDCTFGVVGLGLMGGAISLALRGKTRCILACDVDAAVLETAKRNGVIDAGFLDPQEMLPVCDVVYLCLNPLTMLAFLDTWMPSFGTGALLTDIAGVKTPIVTAMEEKLRPDLDFVPGHPMAGSEKGGFAQAKSCVFTGKNYILTPLKRNKAENIEFIKNVIYRMGFSRVTETTAEDHDRKIAFTSQLCHVIAAALIDCEPDSTITRFGGGSFEDLTRIAMLNAPQWTELFLENKRELLRRVAQFEGSLDRLKALIAGERKDDLQAYLQTVRDRRASMK